MILTGQQIRQEVLAGRIHIDDFDEERLEPNSYGFRLAADILRYEQDVIDTLTEPRSRRCQMDSSGMLLEPGHFYLGATMEAMGSTHHAATLYACRSVSTLGMWIQFSAPLGHCGAVFPWTLEIAVAHRLRVYPAMVVGKLAFWSMQGEPASYDGRYVGSSSAVASRMNLDVLNAPDIHRGESLLIRAQHAGQH